MPKADVAGNRLPNCNVVVIVQSCRLSSSCVSVGLQDFPDVPKSAKYDGKVKPDKIEWDQIIKDALEAGKEVPEIDWAKPGADAGLAVSMHRWAPWHLACSPNELGSFSCHMCSPFIQQQQELMVKVQTSIASGILHQTDMMSGLTQVELQMVCYLYAHVALDAKALESMACIFM